MRPTVTKKDLKTAKSASLTLGIPVHVIATDEDQKVVYVNESFESFTGFTKEEVLGRKCNFLQGEGTDPRDLMDMRLAVKSLRETNVVVLNYTKSHHAFWNTLRIRPIFHGPTLKGFVGEIFSLPVNDEIHKSRPRLCLDDALALMRVTSGVPRALSITDIEKNVQEQLEEEEDAIEEKEYLKKLKPCMKEEDVVVAVNEPQRSMSSSPSAPLVLQR